METAERNGVSVTSIKGKNVTRSCIEENIKAKNPGFIAFVGHGTDDIIAGHNNEPLIELGDNDNLLKSRIVHSFTCSSAKNLGAKCGSRAFIGYDDIFWLYMDGNKTTRPLEDENARPFMESAIEAPKQIIKRKTAGEAYEESQTKYQQFIDDLTLSSSRHTAEELQVILPLLHSNKNCQALHGNRNGKI